MEGNRYRRTRRCYECETAWDTYEVPAEVLEALEARARQG
jgi:hypothetical protein